MASGHPRGEPPVDQWPPWASPSEWREANAAIAHLIAIDNPHLRNLQRRAMGIGKALEALFPTMEGLCRRTCPTCQQPCCRVAKPWFDMRDLLFLHLTDTPIAPSQPIRNSRDHCRYLSQRGCTLPRITRPWICTWYLCPSQTEILCKINGESARSIEKTSKWVGFQRKQLEAEWIDPEARQNGRLSV
jgi:hypothetical protein